MRKIKEKKFTQKRTKRNKKKQRIRWRTKERKKERNRKEKEEKGLVGLLLRFCVVYIIHYELGARMAT